jgi:RNA polymerase sigma factor (sigma-70 family)
MLWTTMMITVSSAISVSSVPGVRPGADIPTRYSLLGRLHNWEDQESWRIFFDTYWRLIHSLALRSGLNEAEAQDVVQETVISVAKDIHKFKRDPSLGSFKGWLRTIIGWRIADQYRRRRVGCERNDGTDFGEPPDLTNIPDDEGNQLEKIWQAEWRANLFGAAVDRIRQQVKGEHFQIFDLYVIKGWPVLKVARSMGVSIGQVYLIKHRISGLIKKEIMELEKKLF